MIAIIAISMTLVLLTSFFSAVEQAVAQTDKYMADQSSVVVGCMNKLPTFDHIYLAPSKSKTVACVEDMQDCGGEDSIADICLVGKSARKVFWCDHNDVWKDASYESMKSGDIWRVICITLHPPEK